MSGSGHGSARLRRRVVFPLLLGHKWSRVKRFSAELEESQWFPPERLRDLQLGKLRNLVAHAERKFPFYRRLFAEAGVRSDSLDILEVLSRLPVLEKADVATLGEQAAPRRGITVRTTAGSSGEPTRVLASPDAHAWSLAARFRGYAWHGVGVGEREARFWGRVLVDSPAERIRNRILNRTVFSSGDLDATSIGSSLERWRDFAPDYVYGYASLVRRFADLMRAARCDFAAKPPTAAVVTAESSTRAERADISSVFGCPVIEEYGCSECDIIAFECPAGSLHLVSENVLVEQVPTGSDPESSELVVTDLNNLHMPLIRYRIGDLGALSDEKCSCGRGLPVLTALHGRTQQQYIVGPEGRRIRAGDVAYVLDEALTGGVPVRRFQIRQETPDGLVVLVVLGSRSPEIRSDLALDLRTRVCELLGDGFGCDVVFVDEISVEAGRKFSYFVSELGNG